VVALILGVMNDTPVPKLVPPVAAAYQLMVPALAVAPNVTVPVPQRLAAVLAVMVGIAFTVTALVVAEQPAVVVKVNVALPAETPVMTPVLPLMAATAGLELVQVPVATIEGLVVLYG
jgi:hypothetical protein